MSTSPLVKIVFERDDGGTETLWAERLGMGRFRVDNSPFYVYGLSFNDVVFASAVVAQPHVFTFAGIADRGGRSTYRISNPNGLDLKA